jgi:hypothetical protein
LTARTRAGEDLVVDQLTASILELGLEEPVRAIGKLGPVD